MNVPGPDAPVVEVTDVFVAYRSGAEPVMALRGADLRLAAGERLLVAGPNGSGKSTLLRVVTGDQPVLAGRVEVGGASVHAMDEAARRRWRTTALGFVDQHARRNLLPELDVRDNVALQLRLTGTPAREARRRAGATLERLGLGALATAEVRRLSGGEAQRVALCAAVAHGPALVLADEPTGELDDDAARDVHGLLEAVAADGTGVILVSHDARSARFVDRAVRLRDGRLAEEWFPRRPGPQARPSLVADSRGWVRLPSETVGAAVRDATWDATWTSEPQGERLVLAPRTAAGSRAPAATVRPRSAPAPRSDDAPLAELTGVRAAWGARTLFDDLGLVLPAGSWTAVRGPSGSGKSTLLNLVAGLLDPVAGQVAVGGAPWSGLDREGRAAHRRRWLAYGLQRANLVETMTVGENVALATSLRDREATDEEVTALVGRLGLGGQLGSPAGVLSGGERQRASLARVLVAGTPVLVLDEPTSQQDEASAGRVVEALADAVGRGTAVLVASHDPVVLERATASVVL